MSASSIVKVASLALGSLLLSSAAHAAPSLHTVFEKYTLPNGLTVILHEDHHSPTVVVDSWVHVGSKEEAPGKSGFAHLFEHLMFMGTEGVPNGQFDKIMEAAGGQNNASTSTDRTNYYEEGPANLLETFLWLDADRLTSLADGMTKEKVDLQRDVVKNERRQSYENRPYGRSELLLSAHMYPAGHPYHHSVIGSHEDLTAASVDDVKQFFATYYVASNISVVVSGDFQPMVAKKLIAKYLGRLLTRPVPPHETPAPIPALSKSDALTVTDHVQLERVTLAWHSPPAMSAGDAECDLLSLVLGGGKSSRLYQALVQTKLAGSVNVAQRTQKEGSLFTITATAQPGHTAAELEQAIAAQLAQLEEHPATQAELDRARNLLETETLQALEQPLGLAELLNAYQLYFGDPAQIDATLLARYDAITTGALASRAASLLHAPRFVLRVVPEPPPAPAKSPAPQQGH
jgi:zinc protease